MGKNILKILLFTAFVCAIFGNAPVFAQDEYCANNFLPEYRTCSSWRDSSVVVTVSSPNYTACPVTATFKYRKCNVIFPGCPETIIWQCQLESVDWDWDACQSLTAYLYPGYPDDFGSLDWNHWNQFVQDVQRAIAMQNFTDFYNGLPDPLKVGYQCIGPNCDFNPCYPFSVSFTSPRCRAICEYRHGSRITQTFMDCLPFTENCCRHEMHFCYCVSTGQVKVSESVVSQGASCTGTYPSGGFQCNPFGDPKKQGDYRLLRPCAAQCD